MFYLNQGGVLMLNLYIMNFYYEHNPHQDFFSYIQPQIVIRKKDNYTYCKKSNLKFNRKYYRKMMHFNRKEYYEKIKDNY